MVNCDQIWERGTLWETFVNFMKASFVWKIELYGVWMTWQGEWLNLLEGVPQVIHSYSMSPQFEYLHIMEVCSWKCTDMTCVMTTSPLFLLSENSALPPGEIFVVLFTTWFKLLWYFHYSLAIPKQHRFTFWVVFSSFNLNVTEFEIITFFF